MNKLTIPNLHKQTGAALITCLALLVVLTLIGLSGITTTTTEEKMTGSVYNKQASFQAAEAVLRDGEDYAENFINIATDFANCETGCYDKIPPSDTVNYPVWDSANGKDSNGWYTNANNANSTDDAATLQISGQDPSNPNSFDPSFIIENYTGSLIDVDCNIDLKTPAGSSCENRIYRITARSQGLNDQTSTILQSTYKIF